ncbi:aldo/keto reductase [Clostridia bacterium]|nr:aldo/keto reductase [Clostridia bacterium]
MEKRNLDGNSVSLLGFGCMRLPLLDKSDQTSVDLTLAQKMIDAAYARGVNYFDTAYVYHGGKSEEITAKLLKKYPRESYYVATKYPIWNLNSAEDIPRIFEEQLARLDTDYIDYYLLHGLNGGVLDKIEEFGLYDYFAEQKKLGRIRHLGFSFHDAPEVLEKIIAAHKYDFAQIQLNYYDWTYQKAEIQYNILKDANIPVIVMEPIRGGFLANPTPEGAEYIKSFSLTPANLALRYAAQYENVKVILSGMSSFEQVAENLDIFTDYKPLTQTENDAAKKVSDIIEKTKSVPCTECRYCMDCPSGVDIPGIFKLYNHYMVIKDEMATAHMYQMFFTKQSRPENCVNCGACVTHCPQHIAIPDALAAAKETLGSLRG